MLHEFTYDQVYKFLVEADSLFPTSLSKLVSLEDWTEKLINKANMFCTVIDNRIASCVAGYIDNAFDDKSYIAIVGTLPEYQGKGFAKDNIIKYINQARVKGLRAVHLYAVKDNYPAVKMYKSLGFVEYNCIDETRKEDIHLILNFNNK